MASTQLGAPDVAQNQSAPVTVNEAVAYLDAHVHLAVINRTTATPPGSPTTGDRYLIAASPTGAWTGQAGSVAFYLNGAWKFSTPKEGWWLWDAATDKMFRYTGAAWLEVSLRQEQTMGITLANPTASENKGFYFTKRAITVTQATAVVLGTSPSVTYQVKHDTSRSGSGNNLFSAGQTVTSTTTGSTSTTFSDATIPANSYVWLTTSASSGPATDFQLMLFFTED